MQKRDATFAGPAPGRFIDQAVPKSLTALQRGIEIGDAVANVVDARPASGQKLGDGTRGIARLEELDVDGTEPQADDPGAIGGFRMPRREAEDVPVEGQGVGDARDGDADVSD